MKTRPATGRRASDDERQRARDLVDTFRVDGDPEPLLQALQRFAEVGTFADVVDWRPAYVRTFDRAIGRKMTLDEKAFELADEIGLSFDHARRLLRKTRAVKVKP